MTGTIKAFLDLTEEPGCVTLWDRRQYDTDTEVVLVKFTDSSIGLLPFRQARALAEVLEYNWSNEELDFAQTGDPDEDGIDEQHIVHRYRQLAHDGGPQVKPYLDEEQG